MKVNISDLIGVNGASMKLNFEEAPAETALSEDCRLEGKLSFAGTLTNSNGILQLDGCLKVAYSSECFRCLGAVHDVLELKINENFINSADAEGQTDLYPFEGKELDLGKVLNDNLILNLPMRQLCSEKCKGLCSKCGANLNKVQCGCSSDEPDSRLEGLNRYFEH